MTVTKRTAITAACVAAAAAIIVAACAGGGARQTDGLSLPTVVIDAGHGGIDAGVYGVNTGVKESDINLAVAAELRGRFAGAGFDCVMTRTTHGGLYGSTAKGFKMRDMQARKKKVDESGADIVISIHQNTCPLPSRRGPHVFSDRDSEASGSLAQCVQQKLNELYGCDNQKLFGDYYMLRCTAAPSIIVECGFLSNGEDEELLSDPSFRSDIAEAIFKGVIYYLS